MGSLDKKFYWWFSCLVYTKAWRQPETTRVSALMSSDPQDHNYTLLMELMIASSKKLLNARKDVYFITRMILLLSIIIISLPEWYTDNSSFFQYILFEC